MLVAKKKENYRKLLDECKSITLDSSFKDIKKLIKDDPRYSRYVPNLHSLKFKVMKFDIDNLQLFSIGIQVQNGNVRSSSTST